MNPAEIDLMARVEGGHWWYRGLRDALDRALAHPAVSLPPSPRVLDAGCGTGATLAHLRRTLAPGYLGGFDPSERALGHARARAPGADLYAGDLAAPEIRVDALDLVVCLDVIYIPGIAAVRDGLAALAAALAPGGALVLNAPAYAWLASEHDLAVGTTERYTRGRIGALLDDLDLETVLLTYRLCPLLPLVAASRLARRAVPASRARSDLHREVPPAVAAALLAVTRLENRLIGRGATMPFGSSVFALALRR